jgi:RNA polymerase sigma-70 factor (sigma-E family)
VGKVEVSPAHPALIVEGALQESFEQLFERERVPMVRVAYLIVGSAALAEELVQEAFAQLLDRWNRVEHPASYLRTCVVNGAKRANRRRRLEETILRRALPDQVAESAPDYLQDALAALPVRQRAALVLRFYDRMSEVEIAEVLKCRPGTVKSLVSRGLVRLREVIDQ